LSGAKEKSLAGFRLRLKAALQRLKDAGMLDDFEIRNDLVYVVKGRPRLAKKA
jgi:hypothetical protein